MYGDETTQHTTIDNRYRSPLHGYGRWDYKDLHLKEDRRFYPGDEPPRNKITQEKSSFWFTYSDFSPPFTPSYSPSYSRCHFTAFAIIISVAIIIATAIAMTIHLTKVAPDEDIGLRTDSSTFAHMDETKANTQQAPGNNTKLTSPSYRIDAEMTTIDRKIDRTETTPRVTDDQSPHTDSKQLTSTSPNNVGTIKQTTSAETIDAEMTTIDRKVDITEPTTRVTDDESPSTNIKQLTSTSPNYVGTIKHTSDDRIDAEMTTIDIKVDRTESTTRVTDNPSASTDSRQLTSISPNNVGTIKQTTSVDTMGTTTRPTPRSTDTLTSEYVSDYVTEIGTHVTDVDGGTTEEPPTRDFSPANNQEHTDSDVSATASFTQGNTSASFTDAGITSRAYVRSSEADDTIPTTVADAAATKTTDSFDASTELTQVVSTSYPAQSMIFGFENNTTEGWEGYNRPWIPWKTSTDVVQHYRNDTANLFSLRVTVTSGHQQATITRSPAQIDPRCITGGLGDALVARNNSVVKIVTNAQLVTSQISQVRLDIVTTAYSYSAVVNPGRGYGVTKALSNSDWLEYNFGEHKLTESQHSETYVRLQFSGLKYAKFLIDEIRIECQ